MLVNLQSSFSTSNWQLKKTRKIFSSFDSRFEISVKKRFRNTFFPDAHMSKIVPYGMASLCITNEVVACLTYLFMALFYSPLHYITVINSSLYITNEVVACPTYLFMALLYSPLYYITVIIS